MRFGEKRGALRERAMASTPREEVPTRAMHEAGSPRQHDRFEAQSKCFQVPVVPGSNHDEGDTSCRHDVDANESQGRAGEEGTMKS